MKWNNDNIGVLIVFIQKRRLCTIIRLHNQPFLLVQETVMKKRTRVKFFLQVSWACVLYRH